MALFLNAWYQKYSHCRKNVRRAVFLLGSCRYAGIVKGIVLFCVSSYDFDYASSKEHCVVRFFRADALIPRFSFYCVPFLSVFDSLLLHYTYSFLILAFGVWQNHTQTLPSSPFHSTPSCPESSSLLSFVKFSFFWQFSLCKKKYSSRI